MNEWMSINILPTMAEDTWDGGVSVCVLFVFVFCFCHNGTFSSEMWALYNLAAKP